MNRIKGKLALITGASSGIGLSCARRLAAEGANLVLWARRLERLEQAALEIGKEHGVAVRVAVVDVRDREAVNRAPRDDVVLITGSLYVVGDAMRALGVEPE
jgi:NADP-dependent 3-hydroxy acid dehydrogenase YdfG